MSRFDSSVADDVGRSTYAPLSDAGNRPPNVHFEVQDTEEPAVVMIANPPGAILYCECLSDDESAVRITSRAELSTGHIANVLVRLPANIEDKDITTETIAIASALYWSWWRAEDMRGRAPR